MDRVLGRGKGRKVMIKPQREDTYRAEGRQLFITAHAGRHTTEADIRPVLLSIAATLVGLAESTRLIYETLHSIESHANNLKRIP